MNTFIKYDRKNEKALLRVQGWIKKFGRFGFPITLGLLLTLTTLAWAATQSFEETSNHYPPDGLFPPGYAMVYEVNLGSDGYLYLSDDSGLGDLRRVDPATGAYTQYTLGSSVLDAKPDGEGGLWFLDGADGFNRLDLSTDQLTTWLLPTTTTERNLRGLDFDAQGQVWMSEFVGAGASLFSYDLDSSELCTYTLELRDLRSYYVLHDGGRFWLGNWEDDRIYRVNPQTLQADYWSIGDISALPKGLALDRDGSLWWADQGMGALGHLNPQTNQISLFHLPEGTGTKPQMLAVRSSGIWYTENLSGTVGWLDPATAMAESYIANSGSQALTVECGLLEPADEPIQLYPAAYTFAWTPGTLSPVVEGGGWLVYQLPEDSGGIQPAAYGIAPGGGYLWITDQGRQKLVRLPLDEDFYIYLPVVLK